ncbi:MAG: hypothetical protein ACLSH5_03610 [Christensenellales bacterium]
MRIATPGEELSRASQVAEQVIRPTGLLDPEIECKVEGQVDDRWADKEDRRQGKGAGHYPYKANGGDADGIS